MSPRAPRVTGPDLLRALQRAGWYRHHHRGSHVYLRHPTRPGQVVVAVHAGEIIKQGTLAGILATAGLSVEELRDLL
jgi:predicted RNA binding protein YcfA (HicA-like mRNA interferase family)